MSTIAEAPASSTRANPAEVGSTPDVPWYVWAVVFASTSVLVGVTWDISWHRTIGRDTFWTPAHLAIYLGGATAGLACGWLVLRTTFAGTESERAAGVSFWGFRGPLGAWICIWGSLAMIVSGPFDDWWHNAYGLDVEILSPPHTVLAAGIVAIQIGAMMMVLARHNNVRSDSRLLPILLAYTGGILILMLATLATEEIAYANEHRNGAFYMVSAGVFPLLLVGISRCSLVRFGATAAAGFYMVCTILMIWVLQLFPAEPLLGPILRPVDSMVPPAFPLLLVIPALAVDLLVGTVPARDGRLRAWLSSVAIGAGFVLALLAVQWYFSAFLLSEAARNFVFGADQWDYNSSPGPWQYEYWGAPLTIASLGWAVAIGAASARVGLWWGDWMARVRR